MTSQHVFYDERTKCVAVSFWTAGDNNRITTSLSAYLTLGEAHSLAAKLSKTLALIPPEPRVVSAEDLGL